MSRDTTLKLHCQTEIVEGLSPDDVFFNPHVCSQPLDLMPEAIQIFLLEIERMSEEITKLPNNLPVDEDGRRGTLAVPSGESSSSA